MSARERSPASARTVLFVSLATGIGGAERSLALLIGELAALGWRASLAGPDGPALRLLESAGGAVTRELRGVPAISTAGPERRYRARSIVAAAGASLDNARAIARSARGQAGVVVSNSFHAHPSVVLGARLAGVPSVLYLRDMVRPGVGQRGLRAIARRAAATIAISRAVQASLPGVPMQVIENAVPLSAEAAHGSWRSPVIGYLGRLDPEKGVEDLIAATPRLPGVVEIHGAPVVSDPGYAARLERMATEVAPGRIRLCGWTDDPERALARFSVLVVPSRREPWGRVAAEAMAVGVPVVAASSGGLPELVEDGVSGLLYPPGDVGSLVERVGRIADDPDLRERLVAGGRARVGPLSPAHQAADVARLLAVVAR